MKIINYSKYSIILKHEDQIYTLNPNQTLNIPITTHLIVYRNIDSFINVKKEKIKRKISEYFYPTLYPYNITYEFHIKVNCEFNIQNINTETLILKSKIVQKDFEGITGYYYLFELQCADCILPSKANFISDKDNILKEFTEIHTKYLKKEKWYKFLNFPPIKSHLFLFFGGFFATTAIFYPFLEEQKQVESFIYVLCVFILFLVYGFLRYKHLKKQIKSTFSSKQLNSILDLTLLNKK